VNQLLYQMLIYISIHRIIKSVRHKLLYARNATFMTLIKKKQTNLMKNDISIIN